VGSPTGIASGDVRFRADFVCFTPYSVVKLGSRKNHATLIRHHIFLGKNDMLHPWFRFYYCVSTPAK
jgi:hypothetical protein